MAELSFNGWEILQTDEAGNLLKEIPQAHVPELHTRLAQEWELTED